MANIWNIASKGLLATGISGFPVGVSSFAHSSKFSNNKQMAAQKAALEQSKIFLENEVKKLEKKREEWPTIEKNKKEELENLKVNLTSKEKETAQGVDEGAKSASTELQKMMKRKLYSCENYESRGLTKVTKKIKLKDEEKEISYCYFAECDGKLFFKSISENAISNLEDFDWTKAEEGCFSITLKHENNTIKGDIKFGFKSDTWKYKNPKKKNAVLFTTTIEFHKENKGNDKFENTLSYLESDQNNRDWIVKDQQKWSDSNKNKYTYEDLKSKLSGAEEFKKLNVWNKRSSKDNGYWGSISPQRKIEESVMRNLLKEYLDLFYKGSDLWNWEQSNIEGKNHFDKWDDKVWVKIVNYNRMLENNDQTRDRLGLWKEISLE